MPFAIVWSRRGDEDFERLAAENPIAASQILEQIDHLAADSVGLALPPSFPNPLLPKYTFWIPVEGGFWFVTVLFRHLGDEASIEIRGIARQFVPADNPLAPPE
jgi:hypothetical protein